MDGTTDRRQRALIAAAWVMAAAVVTLVALGFGLDRLTGSPRVCAACHEMRPAVAAWRTSAHTRVRCPSCHQQPRPWYAFPRTLAERGVLLGRDIEAHLRLASASGASVSLDGTMTIPDSTCESCHDAGRKVSIRYGTLIKHAEHAERNKSCVSCHLWTAHPDPSAERPLLLMGRCFTCHDRGPGAKAPGTCSTCHPRSFALRPASHKPEATWKKGRHGKTATADRESCRMCHEDAFCRDCHGLEMPHPAGWADGPIAHGSVALRDRSVCTRCHEQGPNFCTMCHHEGYDPKRGPWVVLHPEKVKSTGAAFCMDCHQPTFCVTCHTTGRLVIEASPAG